VCWLRQALRALDAAGREDADMIEGVESPDPIIHRRRLRSELRAVREAAGKTQRDVAAAMDWSASKIIRIETGAVNISTNDLRALLTFYGVDAERITALIEIARASREPHRWRIYRDVASQEYISFLGYESSASIIRNFEPLLVPGLLQTEEYAQEVLSSAAEPQKVEALIDLRIQRQEIFVRENPPDTHFIVDEAVVRRMVGGSAIMRRQLRHLQALLNDHSSITIRIIPFRHGIYPRLRVPYVIFEFPTPEDGDILYVENPVGEMIIRENSPEEKETRTPVNYLEIFWELEQIAHSEDTLPFLERVISDMAK
jgi:transcriptional regulator with XRE-family HTH domain